VKRFSFGFALLCGRRSSSYHILPEKVSRRGRKEKLKKEEDAERTPRGAAALRRFAGSEAKCRQ